MYNPGVQDISGQLRAQGMQQGISALTSGIGEGIKQYQQNKLMSGQAIAKFEGTAKANPDILQFLQGPEAPQEALKAYEKLKKDGTLGVRDAAVLSTFADTYQQQKQEMQMNQMRAMQTRQMEQQVMQGNQEQEQLARLKALNQFSTPQTAYTGAAMPGGPQLAAPTQTPGPDSLGRFAQPSVVGGGVRSAGAQEAQQQALRANPQLFMAAQSAAATGRVPTQGDLNQQQAIQSREEIAQLNAQIRAAQMGAKTAPAVGPIRQIHGVDEKGNPVIRSVDANTGKELGAGPTQRLYPSPEEAGATELAKETAKQTAEKASKFITDLADNAEHARATIADVDTLSKLYEAGAQSGFGQQFVTPTKAALARIGIVDEKTLASQQLLETKLRERALGAMREFNKGQGAVSNYERNLFSSAMANPNMTKEANLALVQGLAAVAKRTLALDEERMKLKEQGISDSAIQQRLERMRAQIPIPGLGTLAQSLASQQDMPANQANQPAALQIKSVKLVSP